MPINNYLIIGVNPTNNETTVPLDKRISVTFSKHMNQSTLGSSTLVLKKVNGDLIPYTLVYSADILTARLEPNANLEPGMQYQLQVVGGPNGVKSITDDYLGVSRSYEFTTKHTVALSPPTNLAVTVDNGYPSLSWQRPAEYDAAAALSYEIKVGTDNVPETGIVWPAVGDLNQTNQTLLNVPKKLDQDNYYAHVRALNGSETSDWALKQFYVEAANTPPVTSPDETGGGVDIFSFDVVDSYPRKDSVDVTPQQVFLVFSANLDPASVTDDSVYVLKRAGKENLSFIDFLTDYSPANKVPATLEPILVGNMLTLTVALEDDAEYTVIVRESVKSESGASLGVAHSWSFVTAYTQLYGDANLVRRDLGTLSDSISDRLLYSYLKEASDYAYQVVSGTSIFNATDYANGNAPYYVHQYVRLRTSYDVIMNSQMRSGGGSGMTTNIKLGDLSVEKDASTGGSVTGTLAGIRQQMKFYLDLMHGHSNRGYAKPVVVVRGENVAAYPDFLTRTEFKELGQ